MKKTAILLGATGLTGRKLLNLLLADQMYEKVIVLTRRTTGVKHDKLDEHIFDLLSLGDHPEWFHGDVVFCCIGTTKAKTPDKNNYRKIDYGIPVTAARLAKENKVPVFIVMSSLGANPGSRFFYSRIKGEMERDVMSQNIENTYILRPSVIAGDRDKKRPGENAALRIMRVFNFLLPRKYKIVAAMRIAAAMVEIAQVGFLSPIIPSDEIQKLGKKT